MDVPLATSMTVATSGKFLVVIKRLCWLWEVIGWEMEETVPVAC